MSSNGFFNDIVQYEEPFVNRERLVEVPWPADASRLKSSRVGM
jgi:hypothetical protein